MLDAFHRAELWVDSVSCRDTAHRHSTIKTLADGKRSSYHNRHFVVFKLQLTATVSVRKYC